MEMNYRVRSPSGRCTGTYKTLDAAVRGGARRGAVWGPWKIEKVTSVVVFPVY